MRVKKLARVSKTVAIVGTIAPRDFSFLKANFPIFVTTNCTCCRHSIGIALACVG